MKFKYLDWRERKQQSFDLNKITVKKAGVEYNQYDFIQQNREDTEPIETLKKYGCLEGHIQMDPNKMYGDFTGLSDLRGVLDAKLKAEELFYNLPLEDRQHFNNDINQFTKDGAKYLKEKMDNFNKTQIKEQPEQLELGVTDNGNG